MNDEMFIENLPESLTGTAAAGATTFALGEEGDQQPDDGPVTTQALGEEGDEAPDDGTVITQALGEEGDDFADTSDSPIFESHEAVDATYHEPDVDLNAGANAGDEDSFLE